MFFVIKLINFVIILIIVNNCVSESNQKQQQKFLLHNLMNDNELGYYFNTNRNEFKIPNYEIINLKIKKRIKRENSNINFYNSHHSLYFKAFGRYIQCALLIN